jgi:chorismate synthase
VGAEIRSHVVRIGGASAEGAGIPWEALADVDQSPVRCADARAALAMIAEIDRAKKDGDSVGGVVEVVARGVPAGLGAFAQWDRRLDGRIAAGADVDPRREGRGDRRRLRGRRDARRVVPRRDPLGRRSAASPVPRTAPAASRAASPTARRSARARVVKPIPTLLLALRSVDLRSKEPQKASVERSDTCVVPAAGVVAEAMLALVLATRCSRRRAATRSPSSSPTSRPRARSSASSPVRADARSTPEIIGARCPSDRS